MAATSSTSRAGSAIARLADFAASTAATQPADILRDARNRLLDTVGISVAARDTEPARVIHRLATQWGGVPDAGAIGITERIPAPSAALVNGTLAHSLDFDDTHVPSILHPSASVVPAALAAAERAGADGRRLLAAIAVGNEIAIRLGNAGYDPSINNSIFFERGLHATSICGTVGSAAAAAVALGLPADRIAHAMGIACSMGAGILEANRAGGSVKRIHCGWAAHSGVAAAQAADAGLTGPPTVLEGRFGFLQAYCGDNYCEGALFNELGDRWETHSCFVKPYPTNVFTHTGIDAAIALRKRGVRPEHVESVRIGSAASTLRTIAEPREAKMRPESGYHAQFSGPFTFALALRGGQGLGVYLDDFTDEAVRDRVNLELAARVAHESDPRCEEIFPMQFPSIVRVRTTDGRELVEEVLANRGTPDRPLSDDDIRLKFDLNTRTLGPSAEEIADRITAIGDAAEVRGLLSL